MNPSRLAAREPAGQRAFRLDACRPLCAVTTSPDFFRTPTCRHTPTEIRATSETSPRLPAPGGEPQGSPEPFAPATRGEYQTKSMLKKSEKELVRCKSLCCKAWDATTQSISERRYR